LESLGRKNVEFPKSFPPPCDARGTEVVCGLGLSQDAIIIVIENFDSHLNAYIHQRKESNTQQ
jgi:hypothetical protein